MHTSRSLVNGCDGFMYSLTLHHDDDGNDDDDDDDDYNYSGSSKTLADYINEARKKHAICADGSVLEVEIPMPFSVNICPTISDSDASWTGVCYILHPSAGRRYAFCSTWPQL